MKNWITKNLKRFGHWMGLAEPAYDHTAQNILGVRRSATGRAFAGSCGAGACNYDVGRRIGRYEECGGCEIGGPCDDH